MSARSKQLGTAFEQRVVEKARAVGLPAKRQKGSGIYADEPNDAVVDDWLIECKVRSGEHLLTIDLDWLEKARLNAARVGLRDAALVVNRKYGTAPFVVLDLGSFLALLAQVREKGVDICE